MKILVTGSKGFIGKNLVVELKNRNQGNILEYYHGEDKDKFYKYCSEADFVFHLAGVNRPKDQNEFTEGNFGFTSFLLETLKKYKNKCPVMISSSIQAELDNPYGKSKKASEELLIDYSIQTGAEVFIYRFPNVFGKWSKPNYNSVVATFCQNIANNQPIMINNGDAVINLVYIDDVVNELINALEGKENREGKYCIVPICYSASVKEVANIIYSFKESRNTLYIPDMKNEFIKKLYSTYLSYIPKNDFSYKLKMNEDHRGSFTEFIKTAERGQISVNISKPGVIKGNHWHHTKNEKFLVVCGEGVIRFRNIYNNEVSEYFVSGEKMEVIDIPTGYIHNIENMGTTDMVTIMWANETYNKDFPDTYYLEV